MQNIPAVANNKPAVFNAEFVKLTIYNDVSNTANVTVHTFSSAYKAETINGVTYTPLGGLLAVGVQQRDLRVTSSDTSISLSGIAGNNIAMVLGTKIRGSEIEIRRGFYNTEAIFSSYTSGTILESTALRFTGIVTSYNITEDRSDQTDNFTVTLSASSYKNVLENRVAGRLTNGESWKSFNATDTSMDGIASISDQKFDFGKKPVTGASTVSTATNEANNQQLVAEPGMGA